MDLNEKEHLLQQRWIEYDNQQTQLCLQQRNLLQSEKKCQEYQNYMEELKETLLQEKKMYMTIQMKLQASQFQLQREKYLWHQKKMKIWTTEGNPHSGTLASAEMKEDINPQSSRPGSGYPPSRPNFGMSDNFSSSSSISLDLNDMNELNAVNAAQPQPHTHVRQQTKMNDQGAVDCDPLHTIKWNEWLEKKTPIEIDTLRSKETFHSPKPFSQTWMTSLSTNTGGMSLDILPGPAGSTEIAFDDLDLTSKKLQELASKYQ